MYEEGGEADKYIGQGNRFDNVGKNMLDTFKGNLKKSGNEALAKEIHTNAQKSGDPKLIELLTQTKMGEGDMSNNLTMNKANLGMSMTDTPSWYSGYRNNISSPRDERNIIRNIGKMISKDGINLPNYANQSYVDYDLGYNPMISSMYNTPIMDPYQEEQFATSEEPMEMFQFFNNIEDNTPVYGAPPAEIQANEAEQINNMNGMMNFMKGSLLPNFNNVSDPFLDDTDNDNIMDLFLKYSQKTPEMMVMQKGGYVNMNTENPITKFTSGGVELPEADDGYQVKCDPGYIWNETYQTCIPLMRYNYNYRRGPVTSGGLFRTLAPWNPIFGNRLRMKGNPYLVNSGMPFRGSLQGMMPIATDVYKRGLFGRPKRFINYYDPSGQGLSAENIQSIYDNQGGSRGRKSSNVVNKGKDVVNRVVNNADKTINDFKESRRDRRYSKYLGNRYGEDYWYGDREADNWKTGYGEKDDPYSYHADDLEDGIPGMRSQKQLDKLYAWEDRQRFKDARSEMRQDVREQNKLDREEAKRFRQARRNLKNPKSQAMYGLEMFDPGGFVGDDLMGDQSNYLGEANTGPGTIWNTMDSFNTNQNITNPEVEAFNSDPMNNMVTEPSQSGRGLDTCTEEQKRDTTSECYCSPEARQNPQDQRCYNPGLVGVEWGVNKTVTDPEAGVNVFNATMRGGLGRIKRARDAKYQNKMILDNSDPMNLYANATTTDRGDWQDFGSKSGMWKYDQEGTDDLSDYKVSRYGGYLKNGGTHKMFNGLNMRNSDHKYYEQDEEVYMTPEELEQFLAAGGQVEYL